MATDPAGEISELSSKLASVEAVLDPEVMREEADVLRKRAGEPGLWEDQEQAQAVTRRLSYLDGELSRLEGLHRRLEDTKVLFELAESESDDATWRRSARRSTSSRSGRCCPVSTTRARR
jgi:peptide chain release factor 2